MFHRWFFCTLHFLPVVFLHRLLPVVFVASASDSSRWFFCIPVESCWLSTGWWLLAVAVGCWQLAAGCVVAMLWCKVVSHVWLLPGGCWLLCSCLTRLRQGSGGFPRWTEGGQRLAADGGSRRTTGDVWRPTAATATHGGRVAAALPLPASPLPACPRTKALSE